MPTNDPEINRLILGAEEFRAKYFSKETNNDLYTQLVQQGQRPKTMVIACSDSRVDPSMILGALPGELFVVRNVANLIPPCDNSPKHHGTSAALEFAVEFLKVQHIIILGHSQCGGIRALLDPAQTLSPENSFIKSWMNIATEAKAKALAACPGNAWEHQAEICEHESLMTSLKNLHTFPWIESKVKSGSLSLHAWWFDLHTGHIQSFNPGLGKFEDIELAGKQIST